MSLDHELFHVQSILDGVNKLHALHVSVFNLIEDEHLAIRTSDLVAIEKLTKRKVELGESVSKASQTLIKNFNQLIDYLRLHQSLGTERVGILDLVGFLETNYQNNPNYSIFDRDLLVHESVKLRTSFLKLEILRKECSPKIEMNQYLIRNLLNHHQETYRFWQSIASDSVATYGAEGTAKQKSSSSTITIRT